MCAAAYSAGTTEDPHAHSERTWTKMTTWDVAIFGEDDNIDFLDELNDLDDEEIVEAVRDACLLVLKQPKVTDIERLNGLAAATIAAIWAGAPFSAGEVADTYPYIRELIGSGDEILNEAAAELLESVGEDEDVEAFIEAVS
jgi:hypothetical protein